MSGRNHFGRTSSNKLGRVYYLLYFLWIRFDEWNDGRFVRLIRLNAFSSKAMIKYAWQVFWLVFCCRRLPGRIFQWHRVIVCNVARNLQQRDCPGFTPDSLLIAFPEEGERTNAWQRYGFFWENNSMSDKFSSPLSSFCRQLARFCHPLGKTLPPRWQTFAIGMAKFCQTYGNVLAKFLSDYQRATFLVFFSPFHRVLSFSPLLMP